MVAWLRVLSDRELFRGFDTDPTWRRLLDEAAALAGEVEAAIRRGDARVTPIRAGTASGLIGAIEPAGEILRRIIAEAERTLRDRPGQLLV